MSGVPVRSCLRLVLRNDAHHVGLCDSLKAIAGTDLVHHAGFQLLQFLWRHIQCACQPDRCVTFRHQLEAAAFLTRQFNRCVIERAFSQGLCVVVGENVADLLDLAANDERVLKQPAPTAFVTDLTDSGAVISLRYWANTGVWWAVSRDITKRAKEMFHSAGITVRTA